MKKSLTLVALGALLTLASPLATLAPALALADPIALTVAATVPPECNWNGGGLPTLSFGNVYISGATTYLTVQTHPVQAIPVACTQGTPLTISLDSATAVSSTANTNRLNGNESLTGQTTGHQLGYSVYAGISQIAAVNVNDINIGSTTTVTGGNQLVNVGAEINDTSADAYPDTYSGGFTLFLNF